MEYEQVMLNWIKCFVGTCLSYLWVDDPTPHPEFDELDFWGRFNFYMKQLEGK
jgi:hypothetical protein